MFEGNVSADQRARVRTGPLENGEFLPRRASQSVAPIPRKFALPVLVPDEPLGAFAVSRRSEDSATRPGRVAQP